ncbi:MAG: hypothetical protein M1113_00220 [Candidatus Thermoplasmatota archaeon]|nr:hypothetical protein [Candidatus Thermoplasmatota archaeon]
MKGLELCIRNSTRLLEDACCENLSLPTAGALIEIGLEEFAKAFLMMICLDKSHKFHKTFNDSSNTTMPLLNERVKVLYNQINCDEIITESFKYHKSKTDVIRFIGAFFGSILPYFEILKGDVFDVIKESTPTLTNEQYENIISRSEVKNNLFKDLHQTDSIMESFSSKIKESGFYVNQNKNGYAYPAVPKKTIDKMAVFFYAGIHTLNNLLDEIFKLDIRMDMRNTKVRLDILRSRLK